MKLLIAISTLFASLLMFGSALAIVDPFVPADECKASLGPVGVQAVLNHDLDPPGALNDGVNNPAGVGAPVPTNNPGVGSGFSGGASTVIPSC